MSILLTSPSVVAPGGVADPSVAGELGKLADGGTPVAVISNHSKPAWFATAFPGGAVAFIQRKGRQDGSVITEVGRRHGIPAHDFIVLGASNDDVQMAKNGGAVLLPAGWAADPKIAEYGIAVANATELTDALGLIGGWPGSWYFEGIEPRYTVRSLSDVSGKYVGVAQEEFAKKIVNTIKTGGPRLQALLVVAARSLLMTGMATQDDLMWGVYPSSASDNTDAEVLSDFGHRLRTVVSKVRFAKRGDPLFIRHSRSAKRSHGGGGDRTDPSGQIETLHLNPAYRGKITGRNVVMLDDCTTYGVSFGVAAGFLRAAGAASVSCVALGKFGDQLRYYEVNINGNAFAPVSPRQYTVQTARRFIGNTNTAAQAALRGLIK
ncbi:hypothetical protein [Sorangium sp. So ce1151]|uniref:hypothetical protein n=1 Tax=Sorangium sp. So ce1151 TaxID=3133332 RepID=UPI003F646BD6